MAEPIDRVTDEDRLLVDRRANSLNFKLIMGEFRSLRQALAISRFVVIALLLFNLGLEIGRIIIVEKRIKPLNTAVEKISTHMENEHVIHTR